MTDSHPAAVTPPQSGPAPRGAIVSDAALPLATGRGMPAPVALRRLSADVAQSLTTISRRGIDCLVPLMPGETDKPIVAGLGAGAGLLPASAPASVPDAASGATVRGWRLTLSIGAAAPVRNACDREAIIDWSGARMRLLYRNAAALSWLATRLDIDCDTPLDDISAQALRAAALQDLITRLALTGLGAPHIVRDQPLPPGAADAAYDHFSFVVLLQALDAPASTILAVLDADAFGVNLLAALLQNRRERPRLAWRADTEGGDAAERVVPAMRAAAAARQGVAALPMVVRLSLPPVRLPLGDVRALSLGDTVLLDVPAPAPQADGVLPCHLDIAGRSHWRVTAMRGAARGGPAALARVAAQGETPAFATAAVSAAAHARRCEGWRACLTNREHEVADDGMDSMDDMSGNRGRVAMHADSDGEAGSEGRLDASQDWASRIPVRVTFELGALTVPLATLQHWREGSVLTFQPAYPTPAAASVTTGATAATATTAATEGADLDDLGDLCDTRDAAVPVRVRIRVNGMPLGRGELVEVDGQLGVAVTSLFADDPALPATRQRDGAAVPVGEDAGP